jgi:hypothetical protein
MIVQAPQMVTVKVTVDAMHLILNALDRSTGLATAQELVRLMQDLQKQGNDDLEKQKAEVEARKSAAEAVHAEAKAQKEAKKAS